MEMITTCPRCATSFRVTPDHLRARAGQVRCGRCATVFDGFQALITRDALAPRAAAPVVPAVAVATAVEPAVEAAETTSVVQAVEPVPMDAPVVEAPSVEQPAAQIATEPAASASTQAESTLDFSNDSEHIELVSTQDLVVTVPLAPVEPAPLPVAETAVSHQPAAATPEQDIYERLTPVEDLSHAPAPTAVAAPAIVANPVVHDYPEEETSPKRRGVLWAFAAVVAMLALAGQAIHGYRNELVSKFPALKPALAQFCEYAACKLLPLQRPDALKIEASDLQVTDPSRPGVIQLTATLRNYSNMEVGYPALDLVLTDNREHTLVRRIFSPVDYLARPDALTVGIAANAEVTVRIDIDTGKLGAAGFRLNLASVISN
jgi:predicted Zn finger-like uncharacterized protein